MWFMMKHKAARHVVVYLSLVTEIVKTVQRKRSLRCQILIKLENWRFKQRQAEGIETSRVSSHSICVFGGVEGSGTMKQSMVGIKCALATEFDSQVMCASARV